MDQLTQNKNYSIINEALNALTHGVATLLSFIALIMLLIKAYIAQDSLEIISYAIYGFSMIALFLSSTLYHSLIFTKAKNYLQILDHSSIFILIAGSYTPYCLLSIRGYAGGFLLFLVWLCAIVGIFYKFQTLTKSKDVSKKSTLIYIIMGWLCILKGGSLFNSLGSSGFLLLVAGGVSYTIGSLFYSLKRVRYMHVVWHIFVMTAAALVFFSIYLFT